MSKQRRRPTLTSIDREVQRCRRCDLWRNATQGVAGEGPPRAALMFVGEQPGDQEDREGAPFVGPAGRLFREALQEAGIDPATVYLTNAVKHFKWKPKGKRRIHEKPDRVEVAACRLWLEMEIQAVRPLVLVALGATAAHAILGRPVAVTKERAKRFPSDITAIVSVTVHPSSILRAGSSEARAASYRQFVADLGAFARWLSRRTSSPQV